MNGDSATWTIDRLARLAAAALAAGAPTQPNGRIREVPDVRTIRWYTSIGLLDRPAAMRGRTALYGRSHLAQLVAIKRLQAGGLTVAAVQERLLGAEKAAIEEIAMLPEDLSGLVAQVEGDEPAEPTGLASPTEPAAARTRFWTTPTASPADHEAPEPPTNNGPGASAGSPTRRAPTHRASTADADTGPSTILGIRLAPDVTLLLPPGREPDAAARTMIAEAAQPLLDLLNRLGLAEHRST